MKAGAKMNYTERKIRSMMKHIEKWTKGKEVRSRRVDFVSASTSKSHFSPGVAFREIRHSSHFRVEYSSICLWSARIYKSLKSTPKIVILQKATAFLNLHRSPGRIVFVSATLEMKYQRSQTASRQYLSWADVSAMSFKSIFILISFSHLS